MRFIYLAFVCLFLASCSQKQEPASIEEQVLLKTFTAFTVALKYDEVCNGADPKARFDFNKKENVLILGTEQMLAARLGGLMHLRRPDKPAKDLVDVLVKMRDKVGQEAEAGLKSKTCDSAEAKQTAKALEIYKNTHPSIVFAMIDKEIEKQGGKVTSMEEIEAAGKPKN